MSLAGLEPARVWHHFEALSAVPRCSGHTAAAIDHLATWARGLGLDATRDGVGNLVVRKPGLAGRAPVALQSHVDMVCVQDGSSHDFSCDPLTLVVDGGYVRADGTTLGADNGLGVALIQALLEDPSLVHPPLEALFTVDEETDMSGAERLDGSLITARRLLSFDAGSDTEGVFIVGSAGGVTTDGQVTVTRVKPDAPVGWSVTVRGLAGGHSGLAIGDQVGNAISLAARFAALVDAEQPPGTWQLSSLSGGGPDNAIPSEARLVWAGPSDGGWLQAHAARLRDTLAVELGAHGAGLILEVAPVDRPETVLSPADQKTVLDLIAALPNGVLSRSKAVGGLVETSSNLAKIALEEELRATLSGRSSVSSRFGELARQTAAPFRLAGGTAVHRDWYPAWTPGPQSPLRAAAEALWPRWGGSAPVTALVHAGLECGFFAQKLPGLDQVSLGPEIHDEHTPRERVGIASVQRLYGFVTALLETL